MKKLLLISLVCILFFSACRNVEVSETSMLSTEKNIVITEELKREIDE